MTAVRRVANHFGVLQLSVMSSCNAIDLARQEYNVTGGKPSHRDLPRLYWCAPLAASPTRSLHCMAWQCPTHSLPARADRAPPMVCPSALRRFTVRCRRQTEANAGEYDIPPAFAKPGFPVAGGRPSRLAASARASPIVRWWCAVQSIARKRPPSPSLPAQRCAGRVFRVPDRIARVRGCGGLIVRAL